MLEIYYESSIKLIFFIALGKETKQLISLLVRTAIRQSLCQTLVLGCATGPDQTGIFGSLDHGPDRDRKFRSRSFRSTDRLDRWIGTMLSKLGGKKKI